MSNLSRYIHAKTGIKETNWFHSLTEAEDWSKAIANFYIDQYRQKTIDLINALGERLIAEADTLVEGDVDALRAKVVDEVSKLIDDGVPEWMLVIVYDWVHEYDPKALSGKVDDALHLLIAFIVDRFSKLRL